MDTIRLPIWLRVVVVVGLVALTAGVSLFAYRWYVRPQTLSIAVGSFDGEAPKIVSALASRLTAMNAPVRLKVVETAGALESAKAFSSGKTDLAVVRGDVGDLSHAQAVVIMAQAVAMLVAPPGSSITDMTALKGLTVGVAGGEANQKIVSVLTKAYNLDRANVGFRNLAFADIRRALDTKQVRAVLFVLPLTDPDPDRERRSNCGGGTRLRKLRHPQGYIAGLPSRSGRRCNYAEGFFLSDYQKKPRQRFDCRLYASLDERTQRPAE
jgi:TRAP-type uncharacterized transport system substrate-binding protein